MDPYEVPKKPSIEYGERLVRQTFEDEISEYEFDDLMRSRETRLRYCLKVLKIWCYEADTETLEGKEEEVNVKKLVLVVRENLIRAESLWMWAHEG